MAHTCPNCSRDFETRRGLGVHHHHAHGEPLSNRVCANCGTTFHASYEKKYCSTTCRQEGISFEAESNPNYRGGKRRTNCELCSNEFEYYPSEKKGRYCGKCVESKTWQTTPEVNGRDNPRWKGGKVKCDCSVCGTTVERYPSGIVSDVTVCSEACRREWLSETFTGSGHPNWKGGGNGPYGKGWNEVRQRALQRDGYRCVVCGRSPAEMGRNPDVHHITPVREFTESRNREKADAHRLDNVVSLCVVCHRKADFGEIAKTKLQALIGVDDST